MTIRINRTLCVSRYIRHGSIRMREGYEGGVCGRGRIDRQARSILLASMSGEAEQGGAGGAIAPPKWKATINIIVVIICTFYVSSLWVSI